MAYVVNEINVFSRSGRFAEKLTCMLNKNIKKRANNKQIENVENKLCEAAKGKQELEKAAKHTNDIIKESEAAKAYFNLK